MLSLLIHPLEGQPGCWRAVVLAMPESCFQGQTCSVNTTGASRQYLKESSSSSPSQAPSLQDHGESKSPHYTPKAGKPVLTQQDRAQLGGEL